MRSELVALVAAAAGLAAWAPAASAVSVTQESPVGGATAPIVEIADDETVANDITVGVQDGRLVVSDPNALQVRPLVGCEGRLGADAVSCPVPALVRVNALGGDDRVTVTGVPAVIYGGDGNDTLTGGRVIDGGAGDDALTGTDADDELVGGAGADTVAGGGGNDLVRDGAELEPDRLDGGPGVDVLDYTGRPTPVVVDLGTVGQTGGSAGEGDTVAGLERAVGGAGDDTIRIAVASTGVGPQLASRTASTTPPRPSATASALAVGNRGDDRLTLAGAAAGPLFGGSGDDRLTGGRGADDLRGGTGADRLVGAAGRDRLLGERGRDTILARDRTRDRVDGGAARDRATVDRKDRVVRVEHARR